MGWLIGPTIFSLAAAFAAVRIFDVAADNATGTVVNAARSGVFVSAWTTVTTVTGMRSFNKWVRKLRRSAAGVKSRLDSLKYKQETEGNHV